MTIGSDHNRLSPAVSLQHSLGTLHNGLNLSLENGGINVEIADLFESATLSARRGFNAFFGFRSIREPDQVGPIRLC